MKPVILTGLRANNDLHIGNYFGALLPFIDMAKSHANDFQLNLFVPDLHSFTTPIDHSQLQDQIMHNLRLYVAAGLPLDQADIRIYRQSYIPAHSELTVILNSFTGMGEMGRMTQFKDKSIKLDQDRISVGLFDYPVLMASDILLYGATYVPVGDDQSQHLEFARDIAKRMNTRFGELFVVPKPVKEQHEFFGKDQGLRIKDLADPSKKMSKSDESDKGVIFLGDDPEVARKKIMSATTDSLNRIGDDVNPEEQPGVYNLQQIHGLLRHDIGDTSPLGDYEGYGGFKAAVADTVARFLEKFQANLANVNDDELMAKLIDDEAAMNEVANATLYKVQQAVGLRPKG